MAKYDDLKTAIKQAIKQNGNQEITGNLLQSTLLSMVDSLGENKEFLGFASPSMDPGTPKGEVFYFASGANEYVNFPTSGENETVVTSDGLNIIYNKANGYWDWASLVEITQELGNSTDKVVSQKAILDLNNDIIKSVSLNKTFFKVSVKKSVSTKIIDIDLLHYIYDVKIASTGKFTGTLWFSNTGKQIAAFSVNLNNNTNTFKVFSNFVGALYVYCSNFSDSDEITIEITKEPNLAASGLTNNGFVTNFGVRYEDGFVVHCTNFETSKKIEIPLGSTEISISGRVSGGQRGLLFIDEAGNFLKPVNRENFSTNSENGTFPIPDNAKYIMFTKSAKDKNVSLLFNNPNSEHIQSINGYMLDFSSKEDFEYIAENTVKKEKLSKAFTTTTGVNPSISVDIAEDDDALLGINTDYDGVINVGINYTDGTQYSFTTTKNNRSKKIHLTKKAKLIWAFIVNSTESKDAELFVEYTKFTNLQKDINSIKENTVKKEKLSKAFTTTTGVNPSISVDIAEDDDALLGINTDYDGVINVGINYTDGTQYSFTTTKNNRSKKIHLTKKAKLIWAFIVNSTESKDAELFVEYTKFTNLQKDINNIKEIDDKLNYQSFDRVKIQSNINSLNNGGKIRLLSGSYAFDAPLLYNKKNVHLEGDIWNYPNDPNGVYESTYGVKFKSTTNIQIVKFNGSQLSGGRISQIGFQGKVSNGATKELFDFSNPSKNCGLNIPEARVDQFEFNRLSFCGLAAGIVVEKNGSIDACVFDKINADGCNVGIYFEPNATYCSKIQNSILSDCPGFGLYINKKDSAEQLYQLQILGNILVRNGGGFTDEQLGDIEAANTYIKGVTSAYISGNYIDNSGVYWNSTNGYPYTYEYYDKTVGLFFDGKNSVLTNNIIGGANKSNIGLKLRGENNSISQNKISSNIVIEGNNNRFCNNSTSSTITVAGNNNIIDGNSNGVNFASVIIKENATGNIIMNCPINKITDAGTDTKIINCW